MTQEALKATHEFATLQPKLSSDPLVPIILNAFGLDMILGKDYPVKLASFISMASFRPAAPEEMSEILYDVSKAWNLLCGCAEPIETITTPSVIVAEKDFDEILTIEMRYTKDFDPSIETIAEILKNVNSIYSDVSKLRGTKDSGNLVTIYAASGSGFRFDFKGLGEPIKEIKNLLIEAWQRIRHRKAEDIQQNNVAILSSLKVLDEIKAKRNKKVISDEDANKLCRKIINASLGLFEKGALIREIPVAETVLNQNLIETMQPKRLPPPAPKQLPEAKTTKKVSKKSKKKKKA